MSTLADMMENLRNYSGKLEWQRGKDIERMAGGDPDKAAVLEQIMSLGEGGGHAIGGMAGMMTKAGELTKRGTRLYPVKPLQKTAKDVPDEVTASWGTEHEPGVGEYVLFDLLNVPKHLRGQGLGRLAMRKAINEIQTEYPNLPIRLAADALENSTDLNRLVRFYGHEGFDIEDADAPSVIMRHDNQKRPIETYIRPRQGSYELLDDEL